MENEQNKSNVTSRLVTVISFGEECQLETGKNELTSGIYLN